MEIYSQPTFNKGMVTVRQKNASDLSDAYDFVTWCENFTPNKIIGSLIKRAGVTNTGYSFDTAKVNLSHVNKFNNVGNPSEYYTRENTSKLNLSALNGDIEFRINDGQLLGVFELSTSRPVATKIPIVMFNKDNESYVASYYVRRSGTDYYAQWNETFKLPNIDMLDEHKNHIHGIISDYDNIGEVVLFVSKKFEYDEHYHPVYVYAYNDGRRYLEHWFKPDNNPPDSNKEYWHVRKNSQEYKMTASKIEIETMNMYLIKNGKLINDKFLGTARGMKWDQLISEGLFPEQSDLPNNQKPITRTSGNTVDTLDSVVSVVFFQSGRLPYGAMGNNTYNSSDDFWYTVEALNTNWLPYENRTGYKRPNYQSDELYGFIPCGFKMSNNYAHNYVMNNLAFPIKPILVKYKGSTDNDLDISMYIERALPYCRPNIGQQYLDKLTSFEDMYGKMGKALVFHFNQDTGKHRLANDVVIRTMLPKYRGNGTPRPYLAGEKIPFVLTAIINGTETELYRDVYTVQEANKRSVDKSILNKSGTLSKDGKLRLAQIVDEFEVDPKQGPNFAFHKPVPERAFIESYDVDEVCWNNVYENEDRFTDGDFAFNAWEPSPSTYEDLAGNKYAQGLRGQRVLMPDDTINGRVVDVFKQSGEQWKPEVNGKEVFFRDYDATPEAGYVYFTLRINAPDYNSAVNILPDGLTEFKLYFAEGDMTKGLVKYDDQGKVWNYSTQGYSTHRAIANDSNNYRLVKRFTVSNSKGITEPQYSAINESTQGLSGYENTNSWIAVSDTDGIGKGIYAVPNHWRDLEVPSHYDTLPEHKNLGGNRVLNFHNLNIDYQMSGLINDDYFGDLQRKSITGFEGFTPDIPMNQWSTDFCLWDYPTNSQLLTENVSTENWDGVGAGLICVINGLVVIGDLQDKELQPEDGVVRFTGIKNNVIMTDVFPAQNKYRIGKDRHTALISWREQLLAFCETGFYKVMVRGTNPADWIIVDKFEGQGVVDKKHVITTPQGIMFINRNGLFVTDGQSIQELSTPIANIYKMFMDNQQHGTSILTPINFGNTNGYITGISPGDYINNSEIVYDNVNNEIVIVIKGYKWIGELVFNLTHKNWHIRSHGKTMETNLIECSSRAKTTLRSHFCGKNGLSWITIDDVITLASSIETSWLSFHKYYEYERDSYSYETMSGNTPFYTFSSDNTANKDFPIWGSIITDTIGDGINDCHAFKLEMAGIPTQSDIKSDIGINEHLYLIDRVNMNYVRDNHHNFVDLFTANFRPNWQRWFLKNSPGNNAPAVTGITNPRSRESYVQLIPRGQLFRRSQLYYEGYELYYLESLILMYNKQTRRWG